LFILSLTIFQDPSSKSQYHKSHHQPIIDFKIIHVQLILSLLLKIAEYDHVVVVTSRIQTDLIFANSCIGVLVNESVKIHNSLHLVIIFLWL